MRYTIYKTAVTHPINNLLLQLYVLVRICYNSYGKIKLQKKLNIENVSANLIN